jgi:hypothetical protein
LILFQHFGCYNPFLEQTGGLVISASLSRSRGEFGLYLDLRLDIIWYMSPNPHLVRPDRETMLRLTSGMTDMAIARMYGCTGSTVAKWRDRYGIPRSPKQWGGNTIRWKTNRDYFARIDTPGKAYVLGFLLADGHIHKGGYKIQISVKESDADLLRMIARELDCDAPLKITVNHYDGSHMARLLVCGQKLISDLAGLGVYQTKGTTATFPVISPDLENHLVRGLWDGDGHIGKGMFELIGTSALLDGTVAAAQRHTGCLLRRKMGGRDAAYHYAYGTRRDTAVLHWMYSGATIALERKQEKFRLYWSEVPSAESLNLRIGPRVYTRKSQVRSAADYPSAG